MDSGKTFYWDVEEVGKERPKEMLKAMSKSRAREILGVGLNGEPKDSITGGRVYKSFRKLCDRLELGRENKKGITLRDCHEAYQVLIKDTKTGKQTSQDHEQSGAGVDNNKLGLSSAKLSSSLDLLNLISISEDCYQRKNIALVP